MARIILITGGSRSGKSSFALDLAEKQSGLRLFFATCPKTDAEMEERIRLHRLERENRGWHTIEEPVDLAGRLEQNHDYPVILIDCLTLWINNMMYQAELAGKKLDEDEVGRQAGLLMSAGSGCKGTVILVTNEVGLGIVPENAVARLYRDLVGRCNQCIGRQADEVYFVSCGIPLILKGT